MTRLCPFVWIHEVQFGQDRLRWCWRTGPVRWRMATLCLPWEGSRRVNLSSPLYANNRHHNQHFLTGFSASSGQEMRFLAIRQSDFLLSSVSSPLFGSEELVCLFVLSAAQCSALVSAAIQTYECSLSGSVLCSMFISIIYWGVQMFLKHKKEIIIKSACKILKFLNIFQTICFKSIFFIVKSISQSITSGPKLLEPTL